MIGGGRGNSFAGLERTPLHPCTAPRCHLAYSTCRSVPQHAPTNMPSPLPRAPARTHAAGASRLLVLQLHAQLLYGLVDARYGGVQSLSHTGHEGTRVALTPCNTVWLAPPQCPAFAAAAALVASHLAGFLDRGLKLIARGLRWRLLRRSATAARGRLRVLSVAAALGVRAMAVRLALALPPSPHRCCWAVCLLMCVCVWAVRMAVVPAAARGGEGGVQQGQRLILAGPAARPARRLRVHPAQAAEGLRALESLRRTAGHSGTSAKVMA
jgi:hypothetical protein